jgi:8-oxo-dGTP pyrophosphatase MutT (NUDIX family)
VELSDFSFFDAALREALEETGLPALDAVSRDLFDVDSHPIPERKGAPAHVHHDMRFLLRLPANIDESQATITAESHGLMWKPLTEIAALPDESLARLARKAQAFLAKPDPVKAARP